MKPAIAALTAALWMALPLSATADDAQTAEIAVLKAQVQQLLERIEQLEQRTEAQSAINVDTATAIETAAKAAPKVETKGGIKISSPDGAFSASLGGRIHFDAYAFDRDEAGVTGTTEFRRARLTLGGKAYGWDYKIEQDFAAGTNLEGLRDLYIARALWGGTLTIGHLKPYRSMAELTSSNELVMMERPFASGSGLFAGRQHQQGVGYLRSGGNHTLGISVFNLRGAAGPRNEGFGAAARATLAPINDEHRTLHLGAWASHENANLGSPDLAAKVNYAGRRGPSLTVATSSGGDTVDAVGLEAAASIGPWFVQSEYARARFGNPLGASQDVDAFYVEGSWMLNGGHRPYKAATGVFGAPKRGGLWELTARYDMIDNDDLLGREARTLLLGVNYYVNPSLRVMFNYADGDNELTGDRTGQYALRTQFYF